MHEIRREYGLQSPFVQVALIQFFMAKKLIQTVKKFSFSLITCMALWLWVFWQGDHSKTH